MINFAKEKISFMEQYLVSARKYRPDTFKSVVGQGVLTATLKNAIQTKHLAHAYLFCGPRGVGKTTCARIFAKSINCLNPTPDGEPCNECESCKGFNEQRSFNIHELDAASNNSVDDMRSLIEQVRIPPQIGRYSVYIIDEVHMLTPAAFNSFLKTLEEPPAHAVFILATTEKQKVLPTILSRCQIYDFNRIRVNDAVDYLHYVAVNEGIDVEREALTVIAQKADGGMRDALSIFDQVVSFCGQSITYKQVIENLGVLDSDYYFSLVDLFVQNKVADALLVFDEIRNKGFDIQEFVEGLAEHFRNLMVGHDEITLSLLEVGSDVLQRYREQSHNCSVLFLYNGMNLANECDLQFKQSSNKRLLVELLLIRLCQLNDTVKANVSEKKKPELKPLSISDATATTQQKMISTDSPKTVEQYVNKETVSVSRLKSFSISSLREQNTESEKHDSVTEFIENEANKPFTEDDLTSLWREYAQSKVKNVSMRNAMLNVTIRKNADVDYVVEAINAFQQKDLNSIKSDILAFLRKKLENDKTKLSIAVSTENIRKIAFTPEEKFEKMAEENPCLLDLKQQLSLEIL